MITGYDFHLQGKRHQKNAKPCQDYSLLYEIYPAWKIAAVADGVSSSANSEVASEIACKTACDFIKKAFPFDNFSCKLVESDILPVILSSLHAAANAVEAYAEEKGQSPEDYDTTLIVALYNGQSAFIGMIGDSGAAVLKDDGELLFSSPMNDDQGHVYPLRFRKAYQTARVDDVAALFCMTDGIFKDYLVKFGQHSKELADEFIPYKVLSEQQPDDISAYLKEFCRTVIDRCQANDSLTDDLSVALLVNTDKLVTPMKREKPDLVQQIKATLAVYDEKIRVKVFTAKMRLLYPELTDEQIEKLYSGELTPADIQLSGQKEDAKPTDKKPLPDDAAKPEKADTGKPESEVKDSDSAANKSESADAGEAKPRTEKPVFVFPTFKPVDSQADSPDTAKPDNAGQADSRSQSGKSENKQSEDP